MARVGAELFKITFLSHCCMQLWQSWLSGKAEFHTGFFSRVGLVTRQKFYEKRVPPHLPGNSASQETVPICI